MHLATNSVSANSGVKAVIVLLILCFLFFTINSTTMGAPGITYGDVTEDGEIDVRDVVLVMKYILELEDLTENQLEAADVNGDGVVDARDATKIMQYVLGLIGEFPAWLRVESVEEIEIKVGYGTELEDIDFPSTVKAILHDESEKDIEVDWDDESEPEYDPIVTGKYTFDGELVNLPDGVTNPDDVKAIAIVNVRHRYIPPAPESHMITFQEERGVEGVEISVYYNDSFEEEHQVTGTITTDNDGKASKRLVDGKYWFAAAFEDYDEYEGSFEVDGEAKTVEFVVGPSLYEFEISPADHVYGDYVYGDYVYGDELNNNDIDAAYYVYATEGNTSPADYVYGDIDVKFAYTEVGNEGYDNVRFMFEAESEDSDVIFEATDSENVTHTFENVGYWGPVEGFNIEADYTATTMWSLMFSSKGEYEITFSLIDADSEETIIDIFNDDILKKVMVTVGDDPPPSE